MISVILNLTLITNSSGLHIIVNGPTRGHEIQDFFNFLIIPFSIKHHEAIKLTKNHDKNDSSVRYISDQRLNYKNPLFCFMVERAFIPFFGYTDGNETVENLTNFLENCFPFHCPLPRVKLRNSENFFCHSSSKTATQNEKKTLLFARSDLLIRN